MLDQKLRYLIIEQGRTLRQWFRVGPNYNAAYDLGANGYHAGILEVRTAHYQDEGELLLRLTTGNGGVVFQHVPDDGEGNAWSGYIYASASATGSLIGWDDAVYDFIAIHDDGTRQTISRGPAMLIPMVTP